MRYESTFYTYISSKLQNTTPSWHVPCIRLLSQIAGGLIKTLIVLFFLLQASSSYANQSLLGVLTDAWHTDYVSLACSDNLIRLRSRLSETKKNEALVIHIFHKAVPYAPINPKEQRLNYKGRTLLPHSWTFHAVLYIKGTILDFDYTESPHPEDFTVYFSKMWDQVELYKNYRFQIKPLNLYNNSDTGGSMNKSSYPLLKFQDLKLCINNQTCS